MCSCAPARSPSSTPARPAARAPSRRPSTELGLGWDAVGHVILTHLHRDHAGSSDAVLTAAADAIGYAGEADLAGIAAPRPLTAVADGDRVFDLRIVATPGHTPGTSASSTRSAGSSSPATRWAPTAARPALPSAGFTDDMDEAMRSVAMLGGLTFETLLVGHGDPIESGAAAQVAALAGGLTEVGSRCPHRNRQRDRTATGVRRPATPAMRPPPSRPGEA